MSSFLVALQFLTVIPVKIKRIDGKRTAKAMIYFPLVGLFLGLVLVAADKFLSYLGCAQISVNIILVVSLIILTGGIHLDGLADTVDAFLSRKSKEEMLEVMRDSHIGVMGVLSLISILFLKVAFLFSVNIPKAIPLLLMCVLSRWSLVFVMFLFPYARQEGKAKVFIEGINLKIFIFSTLIALVSAGAVWQVKGLLIMIIIAASAYIIGKFINAKIGGITGDTLGAINELVETIVLFSIFILERINLWII